MNALLVMDMQEICVGVNHAEFFKYHNSRLIQAVNQAITANKEHTVIYIRNLMRKNLISLLAPFHAYEGTDEVRLVEGLKIVSDFTFDKYVGDAFSNKEFAAFLKQKDITDIEIVGIDGGGCVAHTALGALKNGYNVTLNTTAIETIFPKKQEKYFSKLAEQGAKFIY